MTLYITIKATGSGADQVRALWARVGALEPDPSMAALGYPPHITFTAYDDTPRDDVLAALDVFDTCGPIDIVFDRIAMFDNDPLVLWLAPADVPAIRMMHGALHSRIDPRLCHPYYRPHEWEPHCTLGTAIPVRRRTGALALMAEPFEPFTVRFGSADCVEGPPVTVLREKPL